MLIRKEFAIIKKRLLEKRRFIQVVSGPRQIGKTTLVNQVLQEISLKSLYITADEPSLKDGAWLEQQWEKARLLCVSDTNFVAAVLVLDEIQKLDQWSETIKRLWDEDTLKELPLQVVVLGSSPLLLQVGLSESLAGRFELIPMMHWSYREMKDAFGWSVDEYIFYGADPGAAPLIHEEQRWSQYIKETLMETTIARDILLMTRVHKPVLLRRLFELGCHYSGQILSYQKMLGQLQDAGNTTTLAHYLELLSLAGFLTGLSKYAGKEIRKRASSPKLMILNTALMSAQDGRRFEEIKGNPALWGRWVETAVIATILNGIQGSRLKAYYWFKNPYEVDVLIEKQEQVLAIEIKSHRKKESLPGISLFSKQYPESKKILVGGDGIAIEEFLDNYPQIFDALDFRIE